MIRSVSPKDSKQERVPRMLAIPGLENASGNIYFWDDSPLFPQGIKRSFWICGVAQGEIRGKHAHYQESQLLVAMNGQLQIRVEGLNGEVTQFELSSPSEGLYVPPMNWVEVEFSSGAVLLGLADREFDESDYIRDKKDFGSIQK
ncbi:FdtA/QdtA family cupin domain-containing protein [Algoriphagus confluentis]|uniref:FdtA/QdtA family cupin domain-containing protein n=1 Tax=Algoriphagus confluentis TaxID=1697556 RepID=A0ABQ6PTC8_9BACT|nr:FdtA/QdtA family cupin domain-containing protein [Algoriphagus confluentis]